MRDIVGGALENYSKLTCRNTFLKITAKKHLQHCNYFPI